MAAGQLQQFVRRLSSDEATDVLGLASQEVPLTVLHRLNEDHREKVQLLLEVSPESAVGLMHLDCVIVRGGASMKFRDGVGARRIAPVGSRRFS